MKKLLLSAATALTLISGIAATATASETGAPGAEIERMFPYMPAHNFVAGMGYRQAVIADRRGDNCEVALSIAKHGSDGVEDGAVDSYLSDKGGKGCQAVERAVANVVTWPRLGLVGRGEELPVTDERVVGLLDQMSDDIALMAASGWGISEMQVEDQDSAVRVRVVQQGDQVHYAAVRYDDSNVSDKILNFSCVLAAGR
jgi:hypothetical protein